MQDPANGIPKYSSIFRRDGEPTAMTTGARKRTDFDDLIGRWKHDPAFDEIIDAQRQIDAKSGKRVAIGAKRAYDLFVG